ncbi:unnamed protein product [Lathyrus sativus]|nr:unnamed protein product [Lathyrus sativus]
MDEYWKRNGQIPAFGNWENANELPITQYFENARQAGLIRYSSSSGDTDPDLYGVDFKKLGKTTRNRETTMRKQSKVYDVTEHPRKPMNNKKKTLHVNDVVVRKAPLPTRLPKPVDEDLYKISPELLRTTKRKKMLGFISKCLVPTACVS